MIWFVLLIAVVLVVLTTAAVLGRVDGSLADATTSMSHDPLPATPLTPGDLEELRFDTAMRGYRMNQVDDVIDRLRREISDLDEELSRIRTRTEETVGGASEPVGEPSEPVGEPSEPVGEPSEPVGEPPEQVGEPSAPSRPSEPFVSGAADAAHDTR